jgi:hypothetical protein
MTDDSLTNAYRAALYQVDLGGGRLELRVDAPCEPLARWLSTHGHRCAALLTAHNPGSQQRDAASNDEAQRQLQDAIRARGLDFHAGRNLDPRGNWPPEQSILVPDLPLADADALARRFGQRAFLWCDGSGTPRLHETRPA